MLLFHEIRLKTKKLFQVSNYWNIKMLTGLVMDTHTVGKGYKQTHTN